MDALRELRGIMTPATRGKSLVEELLADRIAEAGSRQTVMILDASAVLAFLNDEPGADTAADAIPGALISAANLAEVLEGR